MAIILFFVLFGLTFLDFYEDGFEWDYQSFGTAASGGLVLIVNLQVRTVSTSFLKFMIKKGITLYDGRFKG